MQENPMAIVLDNWRLILVLIIAKVYGMNIQHVLNIIDNLNKIFPNFIQKDINIYNKLILCLYMIQVLILILILKLN